MIAKEIYLDNEWVDVYSELEVTNDKAIFIQNKSAGSVYVWPNDTVPNKNTEGFHLKIGENTVVNANGESLYVRGLGNIYVSVPVTLAPTLVVPNEAFNVTLDAAELQITNDFTSPVPIKLHSLISTNNTTSTNLGANQTFLGASDDVSAYGTISVAIRSNISSAVNGLVFETSHNQADWYPIETYTFIADGGPSIYSMSPVGRYFRVRFVNNGAATTNFFIQTVYRQGYVKPSSHRAGDNINGENDVELVKSILTAKMPNGDYTNIHATAGGNLKISLEEYDTGLGKLPVEPYGRPSTPRSVISDNTSRNTVLTSSIKRISLYARQVDARYILGTTAQVATAGNTHYLPKGVMIYITVPENCNIAIIRDSLESTNGLVEISELV